LNNIIVESELNPMAYI